MRLTTAALGTHLIIKENELSCITSSNMTHPCSGTSFGGRDSHVVLETDTDIGTGKDHILAAPSP